MNPAILKKDLLVLEGSIAPLGLMIRLRLSQFQLPTTMDALV
jgi:hypothetical protein